MHNIFRPGLPDKLREAGVNEEMITLATGLLEKITSQTRKRDAELAAIEEVEESMAPSNNITGPSLGGFPSLSYSQRRHDCERL